MPITVLPHVPSFGEELARGLGSGLSRGLDFAAQMTLEKNKQAQKQQLLQNLMRPSQGMEEEGFQVTPEKILAATSIDPALGRNLAELYKTQEKTRATQKEKEEVRGTAQKAFDKMADILKEGRIGLGSKLGAKVFGGQKAEDVGQFESLSGALEAMLVDMVSRGTLSNTRFKYITETLLPKVSDRDAVIRGKLKGLATELGLDPQELGTKEKSISQKSSSIVRMKTPDGKVVKVPKDRLKEAMEAGGVVIK